MIDLIIGCVFVCFAMLAIVADAVNSEGIR